MTIVTRAGTLTIEDAPRVNRGPRATLTLARVAVDRVGRPATAPRRSDATATLDRDVMANPVRVVMAMLVRVVMEMLGPSGTGRAGPVVTGRAGHVGMATGAASTRRVREGGAHPIGRPGGFVRAGRTATIFPGTTTRAFRRM